MFSGNPLHFREAIFREVDIIQIKKRKTWSGLLGSNFKISKKNSKIGDLTKKYKMTHRNLNENDVTMTHHHLKW